MSLASPAPISISPLARSPASSRSPSLAGRPRKPSPLRRSSTPDDPAHMRMSAAEKAEETAERTDDECSGAEDGAALKSQLGNEAVEVRRASEPSPAFASTVEFSKTSLSQSASNLPELAKKATGSTSGSSPLKETFTISSDRQSSYQPVVTKTISNSKYSLPPIRPTPKFPHSAPIRPLRPLSTVSGGGFGSLNSVPHAGAAQAPQRQKIIVPTKSWKACFDLNLTQKELARFD